MLYVFALPVVGVKFFLIFNVVIFDNIDVSESSISCTNCEYLNRPSNFFKFDVLWFVNVVVTKDFIVSADLVVAFSSNFTLLVISIDVVSGVTISGVTLARLYFFKLFTLFNFEFYKNQKFQFLNFA